MAYLMSATPYWSRLAIRMWPCEGGTGGELALALSLRRCLLRHASTSDASLCARKKCFECAKHNHTIPTRPRISTEGEGAGALRLVCFIGKQFSRNGEF